mmetsp:Transcript_29736/g.69506  ORF Transcript_29736/g.69506 Transcript_29736/m.69506 type:complete len:239 (+) Transcript_29736:1394-2110(+)
MGEIIKKADEFYGTKAKGVPVAYFGVAGSLLDYCFPTDKAQCEQAEAEMAAIEDRVIKGWIADGHNLWASYMPWIMQHPNQTVAKWKMPLLKEHPPHVSSFNGVMIDWHPDRARLVEWGATKSEVPQLYYDMFKHLATEIGTTQKVMVVPWAGQMEFGVDGTLCEGIICKSAFRETVLINEAAIDSVMANFASGQIVVFGVGGFDGQIFDLETPHGRINHAGEVGWNNPTFHIWTTRA